MQNSILFLGTAASVPQPKRYTQSIVICGHKECVLLDAGEGMQIRLTSAKLDHRFIKLLAITHSHGDHIHGLLPFIESLKMKISTQKEILGREKFNLKIIAPANICRYLDYSINLVNIRSLIESIEIICIESRAIYINNTPIETPHKEIKILSIPVQHGNDEAYGYYININVKKNSIGIFYSGDGLCTTFCRDKLKILKPLIIIHESTFLDYPRDYIKAHESDHASIHDAAILASDIGATTLILTHISARYSHEDLRDFISRARRIFQGDILIAEDLAKIPLNIIDI